MSDITGGKLQANVIGGVMLVFGSSADVHQVQAYILDIEAGLDDVLEPEPFRSIMGLLLEDGYGALPPVRRRDLGALGGALRSRPDAGARFRQGSA